MKIKKKTPRSFQALTNRLHELVDKDEFAGAICLVSQKGKLKYCNKVGWKDKEQKIPIEFDNIFWLASLTKPIVALAILQLIEDGKCSLDDPISMYIPKFDSMKILKIVNKETEETEYIENPTPITIKHLLTHTAGLSYGWHPEMVLVDKIYVENLKPLVGSNKLPRDKLISNLKDYVTKLAELPLIAEPGTSWWYSTAFDVLGYLIKVISGVPLDNFLKKHIFNKMSMTDTDFIVPAEKEHKLVKLYAKDEESAPLEEVKSHYFTSLSGGGGLYSTLQDYLKFCKMIVNDGEYNGIRIASKDSISNMLSDHLPNKRKFNEIGPFPPGSEAHELWTGFGFGLGGWVKLEENSWNCGIGTFSWMGASNTYFHVNQKDQIFSILLPQRMALEGIGWPLKWREYINLVYDGLGL